MSERTYPDVNFVDYDSEKVVAEIIKDYETLMGTTVHPGSAERQFALWLSNIVIQLRAIINSAAKENVPRYAAGDNLESLTELFHGVSRLPASAATTTIRFYLSEAQDSAQLIPAGTRVATEDRSVIFETLENIYIPIGELYADAAARCQSVGSVGNGYTAGQICSLVDIFPFYDHCENITTSAGGSDTESDDELYSRMRESEDTYSTAGPIGAYIYLAKSASPSIVDAKANSPSPGVVNIFVLLDGGELPEQEILDRVLEKVSPDEVRPLTDYVEVFAPTSVPYSIDFTYYIPNDSSISAANIESAVKEAVEKYKSWQSAKIGRDINPSKLYEYLMLTGIKRLEIRAPAFKPLTDGRMVGNTVTPTQVAQLESENISNGGYEDE